jgi:hypothetical protein
MEGTENGKKFKFGHLRMVAHDVDFIRQWFSTIPVIRRIDKFVECVLHIDKEHAIHF